MGRRRITLVALACLFTVCINYASAKPGEKDCSKPPTPPPKPKCPTNEELVEKKVDCPPDTCATLWAKISCKADQKPKPGCRCKKGFLRTNATGVCIPECDCLPPECANDPNAKRGCGDRCGRTCADCNEKNKKCPKPKICKPDGCDCKDGFVYDENVKKCVKPKDCTPQCNGPNEKYIDCLAGQCIPKNCKDLGFPIPCPKIAPPCPGGCICESGYVRDSKGVCIKQENCPSCGGDENAVSGCGNHCGNSCSDHNKTGVACTLICQLNGCDCRKGFVYDQNIKKCVLPKDCTPTCGENEEFKKDGPADEEPSCVKPNPPASKKTKAGCFCKKGTVRDWNNRCVPIDKCPKCEENSHFSKCPDPCPATCSHTLPLPCKKACQPGCQCNDGYVRSNLNGKCVSIKDCPNHAGCDKNQTWVPCNVNCGNALCPENDKPQPVCDPPKPCPGGCHCKPGYRLNNKGKCILASECPPVKCTRQNEVWSPCPPEDLKENCSDRKQKPQPDCKPDRCKPQCICKKGHFRNDKGVCIPECDCPPQCKGPHEKYVDCLAGQCVPKNCKDLGFPIACPGIIPPCPGGCLCESGYVRNSKGICIKQENCPSCGGDENAVSGCGNHCGNSCSDHNKTGVVCNKICQLNGCDCRKGFVYDQNIKKCVLPKDCTPTCGENEEFKKDGPADEEPSCVKPNPPASKKTKAGCFCKKGTVRDWNNRCVPIDKCPKCEENSHFSKCPDPCPATCSHTLPLPCKKACQPGCQCNDGYVRSNLNGKCVSIKDCPNHAGCDKNQTWVPCNVNCGNALCPENDKPQPVCDPPKPCSGGCHCKPGYRLNNKGKCILASDCPPVKCTRQNEVWSPCPPEDLKENCSDRKQKPQPDCKPDRCKPQCICKKGHFRNNKGVCVPECDCPPQCKGPHEKYIDCLAGQCVPKNCKDLGFPIACPRIIPPCRAGCICESGYVRNSKGICIKKENCPSCGGDENAVSGCGNHCGKSCSDHKKTNMICNKICQLNGCDCRKGFVYDQNIKKCVLPKDCTPTCGENEEFKKNGPANEEPSCVKPNPSASKKTKAGCFCKKGTVRDWNNRCVPIDKCPKCEANSHFSKCPDPCPATCSHTLPLPCKKACQPGCQCNDGYVRSNLNGKCVSIKDCPKHAGCDKNQTWVPCNVNCGNARCPEDDKPQPVCMPPKPCPGGCHCKPGHRLNNKGKCILASECPPVKCTRRNEVWSPCPPEDLKENCSDRKQKPQPDCKPDRCKPRCICKKGHFRNNKGVCVPECDCPCK